MKEKGHTSIFTQFILKNFFVFVMCDPELYAILSRALATFQTLFLGKRH